MINLEFVACGKVQVTRQLPKEDLKLMSTLRLLRETKLSVKRSRGRPPKVPQIVAKPKFKQSHNSDDVAEEEDNDESASIRSETENDDSDESDDKFLKNLERKKAEQIDLEKMTRR